MAQKGFPKDSHDLLRARPFRRADRVGAVCAPWTLLLPDAAEGLLSDAEQRALDQHLATCPACSEELAAAQRGLAWLTVLKDETPEPPADLLSNILARTTGMAEAGVYLPELPADYAPLPAMVEVPGTWETVRGWLRAEPGTWSTLLQPRLAMTAAMAFFSICLTLNLLGVPPAGETAGMHKASLHRTVTDTGATLVRSFHGLRVVYRVESRVNEMRAQMDSPDGSRY